MSTMNPLTLTEQIDAANRACADWESKTFYLGSPFSHCKKLESFASPDVIQALAEGRVKIVMESEYYPPRFREVAA